MTDSLLSLRHLTKRFDAFAAVDDMSLDIAAGEFLTFLGASGSGKTTTLRMIAGFEQPTSGEILMDGVPITPLPPFKRDLNTVFQQYALFPHMRVRENIEYGLRMRKVPAAERATRVADALEMVQLGHLAERSPKQLSGGQQQRVALARAIVNRPRVLLLDEPLGALDLKLRKEMQLELKQLNRKLGITFIYVTHDQEEALTMSDRIALMRNGRIEQLSSPREMYETPASKYVADFIGETNLLVGKARRLGASAARLLVAGVELDAPTRREWRDGEEAWLTIRPEFIRVAGGPPRTGVNQLQGRVESVMFVGPTTRVYVVLPSGGRVVFHDSVDSKVPAAGEPITIEWDTERGMCVGD
jgi:spermidine/putrescine transport system ATP-binding protein